MRRSCQPMESFKLVSLAAVAALMLAGCAMPSPTKAEKPRAEIKARNLIGGDSSAETEIKSVTKGTYGMTPSLAWDASTAYEGKRKREDIALPRLPQLEMVISRRGPPASTTSGPSSSANPTRSRSTPRLTRTTSRG